MTATLAQKIPAKIENPTDSTNRGFACRTILFNDDHHTFEEVAVQCVKAIHCSVDQGMKIANEVHSTGSAVVYEGHLERCEAVAAILEDIFLKTKVERG
jgi:ATP-dependent Clp protease adaptor protein ClpS